MALIDLHSHWGTERGWRGYPGGDAARQFADMRRYFTSWKEGATASEANMADHFRRYNMRTILDLGFTWNLPIEEARAQHDYAFATQRAHPDVILGHWLQVNPRMPESLAEFERCIDNRIEFVGLSLGMPKPDGTGKPLSTDGLWEPFLRICIERNVPVLMPTGITALGAGVPGGLGFELDDIHPRHIDTVARRWPDLKIVMSRPAWPWQAEAIAVMLHKPNVWYEVHGWRPKHFPQELKYEISRRLQDRVMFGAEYPMINMDQLMQDWHEGGYSEEVLAKVFEKNAQAFLGSLF